MRGTAYYTVVRGRKTGLVDLEPEGERRVCLHAQVKSLEHAEKVLERTGWLPIGGKWEKRELPGYTILSITVTAL